MHFILRLSAILLWCITLMLCLCQPPKMEVYKPVIDPRLQISLFNDLFITALLFEPQTGNYLVKADTTICDTLFENESAIFIQMQGNQIILSNEAGYIGEFDSINIVSQTGASSIANNTFIISPQLPKFESRIYDDDLNIRIMNSSRLMLINRIDTNKYLAGVLETEGGSKAHKEYYKAQALISRTYLFNNLKRHENEGFHLCDGVHCQAYKSHCYLNTEIIDAVKETGNLVIVDSTFQLIQAMFHSNCGGQTAGADFVWSKSKSYLVPVRDAHCLNARHATWKRTIAATEWRNYLQNSGVRFNKQMQNSDWAFTQNERCKYYIVNGQAVDLQKIRSDWGLWSTYFSVIPSGNQVVLSGKGYGHGVGLCQEGAMVMADSGNNYEQIVKYYFKGVQIVRADALMKK